MMHCQAIVARYRRAVYVNPTMLHHRIETVAEIIEGSRGVIKLP
jgi:hypothetical protein